MLVYNVEELFRILLVPIYTLCYCRIKFQSIKEVEAYKEWCSRICTRLALINPNLASISISQILEYESGVNFI